MPKLKSDSKYNSLEPLTDVLEFCSICDTQIRSMAFKGSGVCGDICLKADNRGPK